MKYDWVIGAYDPKTDHGANVLALAEASVGYILLNKQRHKGENIVVGFKRAANSILPHHLTYATPAQALKLEDSQARRDGKA